ncbi:MAG TPA: hypothetical protein VI685_25930, partial [Candidatus Angelobacter sp.]
PGIVCSNGCSDHRPTRPQASTDAWTEVASVRALQNMWLRKAGRGNGLETEWGKGGMVRPAHQVAPRLKIRFAFAYGSYNS